MSREQANKNGEIQSHDHKDCNCNGNCKNCHCRNRKDQKYIPIGLEP
jgi:hypothetical protein